jgi:chaperone BCS1
LSGLLNFIDGLWSSCGDERIIVFTTNHRDRLDPALLRPGRMDVHIHLSYCTPCGFKMLASNYLEITEHPLFSDVEQLMETAKVTPAEVGEQLLKNEEPDIALRGLIEFLERKKREGDETKASKEEVVAPAGEGTQEVEGKGGDETEEGQKSQEI